MPNRDRTGPDGEFIDCLDPRTGRRRPIRRYRRARARFLDLGFGRGRGRGRRGRW